MRLARMFAVFVLAASLPAQESIVITSGLAPINSPDPSITFLAGPLNGAFPAAFTPADFTAAQIGTRALVSPLAGGWLGVLPSAPTARWIATDVVQANQASALFAAAFTVTSPEIVRATVDLYYAMDDFLGDATKPGLYINGVGIPGTRDATGGAYLNQVSQLEIDVTSSVQTSPNVLYLYLLDTAGAGGISFEARITVHSKLHLREVQAPALGGTGILELRAPAPLFGGTFVLLPALGLLPGGLGFNIGSGTVWRLDPADPILFLALTDPATLSPFFPVLGGTISPVNGAAVSPMFVPADPALIGLTLQWQAVGLLGGAPVQASNVLATTVGL